VCFPLSFYANDVGRGEVCEVLATPMEDMVKDFHRNDAEQLLIHRWFLEERFHKVDPFM
jgi:hypothetical protein